MWAPEKNILGTQLDPREKQLSLVPVHRALHAPKSCGFNVPITKENTAN